MEDRKLPSLSEYDDEFSKSGEKDFYAFIDRKKQEALANGDQELAEHLDTISNQAYEEQKEYDEMMQAEYEREEKEKRKQREAEYYDDYYEEETTTLEKKEESTSREESRYNSPNLGKPVLPDNFEFLPVKRSIVIKKEKDNKEQYMDLLLEADPRKK